MRIILITLIAVALAGCLPRGYSVRPNHGYWNQPLYPAGYGNHYRFTPQYDRVLYDQPAQYRY